MGRGRPSGRGAGGRDAKGGASFTALSVEEIFEDQISEDDTDVALEEPRFVVSSPSVSNRESSKTREKLGLAEVRASNQVKSGDAQLVNSYLTGLEKTATVRSAEVSDDTVIAQKVVTIATSSSSQRWGDKNEDDGIPKIQNPEATIPEKQNGTAAAPTLNGNPAIGQERKKTWASVVGNRDSSKGLSLNFVPLSEDGSVEFTEEDIAAGVSAWSNAVIGQIMGENPKFKEVVGFVHRAWSRIEIPRIHQLQPGVFLFNFTSQESKRRIMSRNWRFKQEPILMSDWSPDYKPETKRPTRRAVWIKLPGLNLQFWTKQGIEKIASAVGTPLGTDALTANKEAITYARALVDIDLLKPYPSEVKCKLPDGTPFVQKIQYEDLPECPKRDLGAQGETMNKGKEVVDPPLAATIPSNANQLPSSSSQPVGDATGTAVIVDSIIPDQLQNTNRKKKKKNKKKMKENSPPPTFTGTTQIHDDSSVVVGAGDLFPADTVPVNVASTGNQLPKPPDPGAVQERDATVGQENATSTTTEVQEKGIPNAASQVNEEGVPAPNKEKRNRKPNVRIWT